MLLYAAGGIPDTVKFRERVSSGLCDERLFDRFCYTGVINDLQGDYRSKNVSISISSGEWENSDYYLADIYVQDIACFVTAFSQGEFRGSTATVKAMFDSVDGGIVAMNGDFYSLHVYGPVIRNGVVYAGNVRATGMSPFCLQAASCDLRLPATDEGRACRPERVSNLGVRPVPAGRGRPRENGVSQRLLCRRTPAPYWDTTNQDTMRF
jgi:hypothetical protein